MTKFPIDWGDGSNEEGMEASASDAQADSVQQDAAESNQIPVPSTSSTLPQQQQQDFNSKHSLGIGHDSNSLSLAEPMAS